METLCPRSDGSSLMQIEERNLLATAAGRSAAATSGSWPLLCWGAAVQSGTDRRASRPGRPESWIDNGTAHLGADGLTKWGSSPRQPSQHGLSGPRPKTIRPPGYHWAGPSGIQLCHPDLEHPDRNASAHELYQGFLHAPVHCHRGPMAQAAHQLLPRRPVTHPFDPSATKAWDRDSGALVRTVRSDDPSWWDPTWACTSTKQYADPRSLHYITQAQAKPDPTVPRVSLDPKANPAVSWTGDTSHRPVTSLSWSEAKPACPHQAYVDQIARANAKDHRLTVEAVDTTELRPYRPSCPWSRGARDQGRRSIEFRELDRAPLASDRAVCAAAGIAPTSARLMRQLQTEHGGAFDAEMAALFNCH